MFYGSVVTDATDTFLLTALTEHWIHAGGPKREPGRYHTPSPFFTPNTRPSVLIQAVENASPPLVFTAEMCGLYHNPMVMVNPITMTQVLCIHNNILTSRNFKCL